MKGEQGQETAAATGGVEQNKGLFGSIVESVLTPGATQFDIGVINFAFISLILLLIFIFFITDRAKIHVACFLVLAILTYGTIIWYLYVKDHEEDNDEEGGKKKAKVSKKNEDEKKEKTKNVDKKETKKGPTNKSINKNKKKKIY